jgi:hypothetical protein
VTISRAFVLDANVFIEAHRRYYAFDIAPLFWTMVIMSGEFPKSPRRESEIGEKLGGTRVW